MSGVPVSQITMPQITLPQMGEHTDRRMETERPKLLVSIVERGRGKAIMNLYNREGVSFHYQTVGHGTATSEIMDILGLDSKEKDIIISFAAETMVHRLIEGMNDELRGIVDTKGILFDLPMTGMTNRVAAVLNIRKDMFGDKKERTDSTDQKKEEAMEEEKKHSLILISVNQGYTENVIATARSLGARGGTVFRARWGGGKDVEQQPHGLSVQSEKEIIAIVVANELRNSIMDMVNETYGLQSEAQGVVCSMKVDHFGSIG